MNQTPVKIQLVAAMAANRVIGNGPQIPWRIPGEQKIFRKLTEGKVIVMGRKTFESIGRPLPNRTTIVITRQPSYGTGNLRVASSLDQAIAIAREFGDELIVAGGAEIYALAMPIAQRIHLTEIHQEFPGNAVFPEISDLEFRRTHCEEVAASIPYSYSVYERLNGRGDR